MTCLTLTREERSFLKARYREWKRDNGLGAHDSVEPVLGPALRCLIEEHGYCQTDVAMFVGVSRERVRQWVNELGIDNTRGGVYRAWDDDANRFVATGDNKYEHRKALNRRRRERRHAAWEKFRRAMSWVVADLAEMDGEVPIHADLARALDCTPDGYVQRWISRGRSREPYGDLLDEMWERAGYERPMGHVGDRHWAARGDS